MDRKQVIPAVLVLAALAAGTLALAFGTSVRYSNEAGVRMDLPAVVGDWHGTRLFFCQNPECQAPVEQTDLTDAGKCPKCGGAVSPGSLSEWSLLPADTDIVKSIYRNSRGESIMVAMVIGGQSRTSIHRPQICLTGAGREIVGTKVIDIKTAHNPKLKATVLDLLWRQQSPQGGWNQQASFYAYWFVGKNRETPYHLVRMFWMAYDRIVHGVTHRWAYIGVAGNRVPGYTQHLDFAASFIREFEPAIVTDTAPAASL